MGRKLVFHLYVTETINDNAACRLNKLCLKENIHYFNKMLFVMSVNDLTNVELINKGISWIMDVVGDREVEIKIQKNHPLCESKVFKEEILDKLDTLEDLIYFGHVKGYSWINGNKDENYTDQMSLFKWICGLYYFNFIDVKEMENKLYGLIYVPELFYGPFLTYRKSDKTYRYIGTHYWLNPMELNIRLKRNEIKTFPKVYSRYFAEDFPGVVSEQKHSLFGDGLSSHKDLCINDDFDLYHLNDDEYKVVSELLGEPDFINYAKNKIEQVL